MEGWIEGGKKDVGGKEERKKFIRQQEPDQGVKEGGTGGGLRKGEEEGIGASMHRYKYSTAVPEPNIVGV